MLEKCIKTRHALQLMTLRQKPLVPRGIPPWPQFPLLFANILALALFFVPLLLKGRNYLRTIRASRKTLRNSASLRPMRPGPCSSLSVQCQDAQDDVG